MRHARRFAATLVTFATLFVVAATVAYAQNAPEPKEGRSVSQSPSVVVTSDTSLWKFALVAGIAALLTVAVVGLVASLRHQRPSDTSRALNA